MPQYTETHCDYVSGFTGQQCKHPAKYVFVKLKDESRKYRCTIHYAPSRYYATFKLDADGRPIVTAEEK